MFSSTPGLYLPDAIATPTPSTAATNKTLFQALPNVAWGLNNPPAGNHCPRLHCFQGWGCSPAWLGTWTSGPWSLGREDHSPGSTQLLWEGKAGVRSEGREELSWQDLTVATVLRWRQVQVLLGEGTDSASGLLRAAKSTSPFLHRASAKSACANGPSAQGTQAHPADVRREPRGPHRKGGHKSGSRCRTWRVRPAACFQLGLQAWLPLSRLWPHASRCFPNSECLGSRSWKKIAT